MSEYPGVICGPCGLQYGRRPCNKHATWYPGTCGVCGAKAAVTEPRDFGHLQPQWEQAAGQKGEGAHDGRK